jgi:hypothetical protein
VHDLVRERLAECPAEPAASAISRYQVGCLYSWATSRNGPKSTDKAAVEPQKPPKTVYAAYFSLGIPTKFTLVAPLEPLFGQFQKGCSRKLAPLATSRRLQLILLLLAHALFFVFHYLL